MQLNHSCPVSRLVSTPGNVTLFRKDGKQMLLATFALSVSFFTMVLLAVAVWHLRA